MRIIEQLRRRWPGVWHYDARLQHYVYEHGWYVYLCAQHAPRWDGDDDNFSTQFRRSDTGEVVGGRHLFTGKLIIFAGS